MNLNRRDYILERIGNGIYFAWLTFDKQCSVYGKSPEEAVNNLRRKIEGVVLEEIYLVEDFT